MKNYICIDGNKIELSQETIDSIQTAKLTESQKIAKQFGLLSFEGKNIGNGSTPKYAIRFEEDKHGVYYAKVPTAPNSAIMIRKAFEFVLEMRNETSRSCIDYNTPHLDYQSYIYLRLW